jgi:hypothetical protein
MNSLKDYFQIRIRIGRPDLLMLVITFPLVPNTVSAHTFRTLQCRVRGKASGMGGRWYGAMLKWWLTRKARRNPAFGWFQIWKLNLQFRRPSEVAYKRKAQWHRFFLSQQLLLPVFGIIIAIIMIIIVSYTNRKYQNRPIRNYTVTWWCVWLICLVLTWSNNYTDWRCLRSARWGE